VAIPAINGATYAWTVDGGTIVNGDGTDRITIRFNDAASSHVAITVRSGILSSTWNGTILLRDPLTIHAIIATTSVTHSPVTIVWSYDNDADPPTQTLSGTDFPVPVIVPRGTHSYTYTPSSIGAKEVTLRAVDAATTAPSIVTPPRRRAAASTDILVSECNLSTSAVHYSVSGGCGGDEPAIVTPAKVAPGTSFFAAVFVDPASKVEWTITNGTPAQATGRNVNIVAGPSGDVGINVKVTTPAACVTFAHTSLHIEPIACDNPTAVVAAGKTSCGRGEINVTFTGTGPFNGQWSDGVLFKSDSRNMTRVVAKPGTYAIDFFNDLACSGTATGAAAFPALAGSVTLEARDGHCANSKLVAKFTGVPPFTGVWQDNLQRFTTNEFSIERQLTKMDYYSIGQFRDAGCTDPNIDVRSNQIDVVNRAPIGRIDGPTCFRQQEGASIAARVDFYTGPFTVFWEDGLVQVDPPYGRHVVPTTTTTYKVIRATSGDCNVSFTNDSITLTPSFAPWVILNNWGVCARQSASATLEKSPPPSATITWSVTNGTITNGQGTNTVTYTAGNSGEVPVVTCTLSYADSCPMSDSKKLADAWPLPATPQVVGLPASIKAGSRVPFVLVTDENTWSVVVTSSNGDLVWLMGYREGNNWPMEYRSEHGSGTTQLNVFSIDRCSHSYPAGTLMLKIE
jgi:hypothetical protein